ncbi:hypothetical protein M0811_06433 [Anaeramoeba ignava]|uniref:Fibronectin type-III domain-containing protein n=1 Tax=Anaeramoeba ignava TaxID=1746090 RepID=A0A9Q0LS14_ANAIG|nr:hypothetical protein M0811_06433 [Anaeramoeba ignava]
MKKNQKSFTNFIFCFEKENGFEFQWNQEEIVIASDGQGSEYFGTSIDIKGDFCVIGACGGFVGNISQGKAYVFENNGTFWNQKQILIASDGQEGDLFGLTASISNDGKFILIGAPYAYINNNEFQGKAYVFENNGTNWNQKQIFIASDGQAEDNFGLFLLIEDNLILIGSPGAAVGQNGSQGKVYVYGNNGTYWNQKQLLIASDGKAEDNFGSSFSLAGNILVIGAYYANVGENDEQGKVYVFENNGTFWNQKQILIASDGESSDNFGTSVSISNDSSSILVGSPYASVLVADSQGKAYIFESNGTLWNEYQILFASDGESQNYFGWSVAISNDSNFCLIGCPGATVGDNFSQGKTYVFENNGTYWNQKQTLIASDGNLDDEFGDSVSISGNYSLIGTPQANVGSNIYQGKAYIFQFSFPAVNIVNCSSLFSSFECFWNQINSTLNDIEYQINYQNEIENWELIQSPILNQNILYQIFNSSIYSNITGNVDYSIQIKSCITLTQICGNFSNQINLTTRIDSVKNLNYKSYSNSIQLNWNYPNVPIINSIPKLNHYIISYQILNSNQSTNISISNSSTSFQINNLTSLTNYLISIYSCRNEECFGNDKGEISTIQIQTKQQTTSSSKSKTTIIVLSTVIPIIVIISIILIIFLIKKKKTKNENKFKPTTDQGDKRKKKKKIFLQIFFLNFSKKNQKKFYFFIFFNFYFLKFFSIFKFENENEFDWIQKEILIANDGEDYDWFGNSIDIKGNICVIGSDATVGSNLYQGKAYIYENNGTNWNLIQILIASDGEENDEFGSSVSISNDGKFILIGAFYAYVGNHQEQGKSYIFENNGTFWNQKKILISSDGQAHDRFGTSVSISNDQRFILIGASNAKVGNNSQQQGKAYIFQNNGTFWNQSQILIASDGKEADWFGYSVSISDDSSFLLIGASNADVENNYYQGKAYIFQNNGTFWNQFQVLIASDGEIYDNFGTSVSISNDFAVIGSPQASVGNNSQQGKAYIFQNNGTNWNQKQILIASDGKDFDEFGTSVSISNDSSLILIGSPYYPILGNISQGKVYIFQNNETFWNLIQILIANDEEYYDEFGVSVSISNDFIAIGASWADVGNNEYQGKAYVFEYSLIPPQVNILNCSSLFSSFECYWNQINSTLNDIEYQINYQNGIENWELIQSPILNQNVLYQIFNSSIYSNISGNVDYSIQIKSCNTTTTACGNPSNQINLTTRIDSVKNLSFESYSNSIKLNWNYPNVPIINSIPKLNHYIISYQILNSNQSTNISISNSSTSFQINNLESLTNYLISIYSCRNEECYGNDKGEISTIQVQTLFGSVVNLSCSVSNSFDISCIWNKPNDLINPTYYNFTYNSISSNDFGNYSINSTSFNFTAQYSNQEYQINVSSCNSNYQCGTISTFQIKTGLFGPVVNLSCSVSNSFNISCIWNKPNDLINPTYYNFTYQSISSNDFGNYSINSTSFNFTAQYSNQEYQINVSSCDSNYQCGTISTIQIKTGLFGPVVNLSCLVLNSFDVSFQYSNQEYQINVSSCDSNYQCGTISTIQIKTLFGPVLNLSCSILNSFNISCIWNKPNDLINPTYYNFTYHSISSNDFGNYSINSTSFNFTAQYSNQEYQINVSSCDSNYQCGTISTIQIQTKQQNSTSKSKTTIIKRKRNSNSNENENEKEMKYPMNEWLLEEKDK